jgi:hypothetical protein
VPFRIASVLFAAILFAVPATTQDAGITTELQTVLEHDDGEFLWFHPRACAIPGSDGEIIMTLQKHLHKSDFYSGIYTMHSSDDGRTWTGPDAVPELDWRKESEEVTVAVCDVTPGWHALSGKVIAIGAKVRYRNGEQLYDQPQSRAGAYAFYNPKAKSWTDWKFMDLPDPAGKFYSVTPGCVQWIVEPDGTLLVPLYISPQGDKQYSATVVRFRVETDALTYIEHGDVLSLDVERGLVEPSLVKIGERYYLTLRNDVKGYVTTSTDGLHYEDIKPWAFDDGEELGSYNTQQHWLTHGEKLYLLYTRRGADNDHIMRHRAPLFMAEVDTANLHVIRATERVLVPERGATLGNFGACAVSDAKSWVTVSEGVWSDDARKLGATGATYIARILW